MEDTKQIYAKSSFVHRDFGPLVMWKWPAVRDWKAKRPGAGFCSRNLGDDDMGCKIPPQNSHAVLLACIAQRHHLISMDFHIHCCLHRSVHCCLPAASGETFDQKHLKYLFFVPPSWNYQVSLIKDIMAKFKIYEIIHQEFSFGQFFSRLPAHQIWYPRGPAVSSWNPLPKKYLRVIPPTKN